MARVNLDALLQELGFRIHGLVKIVNKEEKTGSSKRDNVRAVNLQLYSNSGFLRSQKPESVSMWHSCDESGT